MTRHAECYPAARVDRAAGLTADDGAVGHVFARGACRLETLYNQVASADLEGAVRRFAGVPDRIIISNSANVVVVRLYDDLGNVRATQLVGAGQTIALDMRHRGVSIESLVDAAAGTVTITGIFDVRPVTK